MSGLIVDNFAGGGGASTGIELALGRAVDIALNHDEDAIRMDEVNHPSTRHIHKNIWQIDPREVVQGRHVDLAWFSPDCIHFSKANGGKPREKSIRDLAWVVVLWAQRVKPDLILLENVEEFRTGATLRRGHADKGACRRNLRSVVQSTAQGRVQAPVQGAARLRLWRADLRKRFFMIARCDGRPIVWPKPTHGKSGTPDVVSGKLQPWRRAAEIIDWSIPCPSIFERKKPLAEKNLRRIAHRMMKFVVNNPKPFIVGTAFKYARACRAFNIEDPLHTVTASNKDQNCIAAAVLTPFYGDKDGRPRSANSVEEPMRTQTIEKRFGAVMAFMQKYASGNAPTGTYEPTQTIEGNAKHSSSAPTLSRQTAVLTARTWRATI